MASKDIIDRAEVSTPTQTGGAAFATSPAASAVSAASAASAPPVLASSKDDAYTALAARVAANEAGLALLQSQVAQLAAVVKTALPSSVPNGALSGIAAGRVFSPFDSPTPTLPSSSAMGSGARSSPKGDSADVSVLTQQIAALSTSVAQLQRLQTQNIGSGAGNGPQVGHLQTSGLSNGHSHTPHGDPRMYARMSMPPLESPIGGPLSPHGHLSPNREYPGPRTPVNRSFGSSLLNEGMGNGMWGAPGGNRGGAGAGRGDWVPSPGSHMQQQREQQNSGLNNNSAAAPGAGIVVTKWEHLQLKTDLLRSISKYGYVSSPSSLRTHTRLTQQHWPPKQDSGSSASVHAQGLGHHCAGSSNSGAHHILVRPQVPSPDADGQCYPRSSIVFDPRAHAGALPRSICHHHHDHCRPGDAVPQA